MGGSRRPPWSLRVGVEGDRTSAQTPEAMGRVNLGKRASFLSRQPSGAQQTQLIGHLLARR